MTITSKRKLTKEGLRAEIARLELDLKNHVDDSNEHARKGQDLQKRINAMRLALTSGGEKL